MKLNFTPEAALMYMQEGMGHGELMAMGLDRQPASRQAILDNPFYLKFMEIKANETVEYQGRELAKDVGERNYVNSMLDIGCGLGLCSLSFYHHQKQTKGWHPVMYLCDGGSSLEGDDATYCESFTEGNNLVSDLRVTMDLMLRNGVNMEHLNCIGPSRSSVSHLSNIDLVVSNVSWFYHYGPEVYWNGVVSAMHDKSIMRVDIRVGPYPEAHPEYVEFLNDRFKLVEELRTTGVPGRPNKTLTVRAQYPR